MVTSLFYGSLAIIDLCETLLLNAPVEHGVHSFHQRESGCIAAFFYSENNRDEFVESYHDAVDMLLGYSSESDYSQA